MGIQLVDDQDPLGVGVSVDGRRDMLCKVRLGSRLADAGRDDSARGDLEVCDEALGSVPYVLELDTLDEARRHGLGRIPTLEASYAF